MKGKHGASAEARHKIEALEAETARLRHTLGRVEAERDQAAESLRQREVGYAAERRQLVGQVEAGTSAEVEKLRSELMVERDKQETQAAEYARQVFDVFITFDGRFPDMAGFEALATIFGQAANVGQLIRSDGPRRARRGTVRKMKTVHDMKSAPEWAQAPAKAAGK